MVDRYGPWAVVLGGSEGLGEAWTLGLARRGLNVMPIARRAEPLEAVARAARSYGVEARPTELDLSRPDLADALEEATGALDVGLVVYNACYSAIGEFLDLTLEQKLRTVDINVRGPLVVAHCFAPRLVRRGRGGLVLMSSLSGFVGTAMVGTYAASKAFDTVLGEALWEELGRHGVDAMVCAAGATLTPNFIEQTPVSRRAGAYPLAPEKVVEEALAALGTGRPTVIPGAMNKLASAVFSVLPRARAVQLISRNTRAMYGASK